MKKSIDYNLHLKKVPKNDRKTTEINTEIEFYWNYTANHGNKPRMLHNSSLIEIIGGISTAIASV